MKMLFTPEWVYPVSVDIPPELKQKIGGSDFFLQVLVRRGFSDPTVARAFLDPDVYIPCPGDELPGMEKALLRVLEAIQRGEKVGIWGDFDVDGQTSTAILLGGLRLLGCNVEYHIPVRGPESHGITIPYLDKFLSSGISLLLTCDTGISANDAVDYANSRNVDVIVTDHHSLPDVLPNALALIDPQFLDPEHPLATLSGAGVAYKFIESLYHANGRLGEEERFIDLAALGLIADMAELTRDARYMVQRGLMRMRSNTRCSLAVILKENQTLPTEVTGSVISFAIAPQLNAVGRLADANPMVEFLLTEDPVFAATTCNQIEGLNADRKLKCNQVFRSAQTMLEQDPRLLDKPLIFLGHPDWHSGVVGIVASRLVGLFHRPVVLFNTSDPLTIKGSARSAEGINIIAAIHEHAHLLNSFGGHPMAAGLSVPVENFDALKYSLLQTIDRMVEESNYRPTVDIDLQVELKDINFGLVSELEKLAPFGPGNPAVLFSASQLEIESSSLIGKTKEHESFKLGDNDGNLYKCLWWQSVGLPHPSSKFDLAFTSSLKYFKGVADFQMEWQAYRDSTIEVEGLQWPKKTVSTENIDLRKSPNAEEELKKLLTSWDTLVFSENANSPAERAIDRTGLYPAKQLAIWSSPASLEILHSAISIVKPERIIWFCVDPVSTLLADLLKQVGLTLKQNASGDTPRSLLGLAAIYATTVPLVKLILQWFSARGDISILKMDDKEVRFTVSSTIPDEKFTKDLQKQINVAYAEVLAFRKYLKNVDPVDSLLPEKNKKR